MIIWSSALDVEQLATVWPSTFYENGPNLRVFNHFFSLFGLQNSWVASSICFYLPMDRTVTSTYRRPCRMVNPPHPELRLSICLSCLSSMKDRSTSLLCPALRLISGTVLLLSYFRISPPAACWPSVILMAGRMSEVTRVRLIQFAGTSPGFPSSFNDSSEILQ